MYGQLIERGGLLVITATALLAALVGVLSIWNIISASVWWQGLLTLGLFMTTIWIVIGTMRYRAMGESRLPLEVVWALVGIAIVTFVSFAGLKYGSGEFVDYDSGYNDGFDAGYEAGLVDSGASDTTTE